MAQNIVIPERVQVLVIGGGPGGSYSGAALAREGIDVLILEAEKFPRYHVGESQLASMRHFLRFIDLEHEFESFGFQVKVGAGFKLNRHKREGYTDFVLQDSTNYSWNIVRSQADELMLRHAARCGAKVFEETKVVEIQFEGTGDTSRPISATWKNKLGLTGKILFQYLIDASGRAGIMSVKYLHNRQFNTALKNVAFWGYWIGAGKYLPGTPRENSPFFEALRDESGWAWFIPLHDGTTSIGVVMNQEVYNLKKAQIKESGGDTGGLSAAATICAVIRGDCTEEEAHRWHTTKIDTSYTRAYQQIRAQAAPVLATTEEDNFDRAFNFFRPIIQGNTETGKRPSPEELRQTIEFCAQHVFEPSLPEERAELVSRFGDPVEDFPRASPGDSEQETRAKVILKGIAVRKLMRTEDTMHIDNFVADTLHGLRLRLRKGMLGLERPV